MLLKTSLPAFIAFLSALALSGCGGGGSSSDSAAAANQSTGTTIQGSVIKGVVIGGLVHAYKLDNGSVDSLLASATTNEQGQFSLQFSGYEGPVYIEVTSNGATSMMICDSGSGCGDYAVATDLDKNRNGQIDFGEKFELTPDFKLTAALPSDSLNTPFSVTTLTHLAAKFAQTFPQGMNDISLAVARSQLEDLFGVSGIGSSTLINLADSVAVANATEQQLKQTLLSSALMGLSNEIAFSSLLEQLSYQLQSNSGQLVTHGGSEGEISLSELIDQAILTANLLNLSALSSSLQATRNSLMGLEAGTLTDAQPSPTAVGATAEIIDAFINDLDTWNGYLSLSPQQTSFANVVSSIGVSTGEDLTNMLKAIAVAGQYGPVVALPDAALGAACDSLGNIVARMTCRILISGKSLQDICEGSLNLVIFNRSLCDFLNDLTLPLGNGLKGKFALYDGVARIYGISTEGVKVDITFTALNHSSSSYAFGMTGNVETETGSMEINAGRFSLTFDGGLDIKNLKLPEQASGEIEVSYQQFSDQDSAQSTAFNGTLTVELDLSGVRQADTDSDYAYEGLDTIGLSLLAEGEFESIYGDHFDGSLNLSGGLDSEIRVLFETDLPDYSDRATVSLVSTPKKLAQGNIDDLTLSWAGKRYDIMYFIEPSFGTRISNQDGVIMDLNLAVEDGETAGFIYQNGTRYGRVSPLNGSLLLQLSDGTERLLQ